MWSGQLTGEACCVVTMAPRRCGAAAARMMSLAPVCLMALKLHGRTVAAATLQPRSPAPMAASGEEGGGGGAPCSRGLAGAWARLQAARMTWKAAPCDRCGAGAAAGWESPSWTAGAAITSFCPPLEPRNLRAVAHPGLLWVGAVGGWQLGGVPRIASPGQVAPLDGGPPVAARWPCCAAVDRAAHKPASASLPGFPPPPGSRPTNEAIAQADLLGWRAVALFQALLLAGKTLLQERRPMLAAVNGTHTLLALLLAALVQRRRRWYMAHREWLVLAASLHVAAVTLNGGERAAGGGLERLPVPSGMPREPTLDVNSPRLPRAPASPHLLQ